MKIVGARWTTVVNMYKIECSCGSTFEHRADRWKVICTKCRKMENTGRLRDNIKPGDMRP